MSFLRLHQVSKQYGSTRVVSGFNLDVNKGEFVSLLGPSGCGKTTTLQMIAGFVEVSEGRIELDGRDITRAKANERGLGIVFQTYALFPHMTVRQNVEFGLEMRKVTQPERSERASEALALVHLAPYADRYPRELSGGQRQRVALARALVAKPRVLLLDEPLSNLDAKLRVTMRVEIKELHQRLGTTMVYVTHDQIEAMTMADKIVVMRDGRVEQIGAPLDLYDFPNNIFVAGFIGSPSMNFVRGKIASEGGARHFASDSGLRLPLPDTTAADGQQVIYGIRPEHIGVSDTGIPVNVVVVEPTGSETQIFAKAGGDVIDAIVKDRVHAAPGQQIHFVIDPAHVHLFDATTEARI